AAQAALWPHSDGRDQPGLTCSTGQKRNTQSPWALGRENVVLKLVCDALSDEGRTLTVVGRPDLEKQVLTVDALIEVTEGGASRTWAADIALASKKFDGNIPAAMKALEQNLLPRLEALAAQLSRAVMVGCKPYVRSDRHTRGEWRSLMGEYEDNIYDRVFMAAMRPSGEWHDSEVTISWQGATSALADGRRVLLSYHDPKIEEGFRFSPAVEKKLQNQLARAQAAGYPTMLILDQKPPTYVRWALNSEPTPYNIGCGLAFVTSWLKGKLDVGVLVQSDDSVHVVYGSLTG
ncbi:hypothetical protein AB0M29_44375, partial [Streptomyces sp. NPDC051976]|uniref:hypothetical protein n=1 Tax=Streptomyces sp. NPDC051976 TaxID=3154947 RepID=UPI003414BD0F